MYYLCLRIMRRVDSFHYKISLIDSAQRKLLLLHVWTAGMDAVGIWFYYFHIYLF